MGGEYDTVVTLDIWYLISNSEFPTLVYITILLQIRGELKIRTSKYHHVCHITWLEVVGSLSLGLNSLIHENEPSM